MEVNIRVSVCLLGCNFKYTGTLIFISAVTGTGALATALFIIYDNYINFIHTWGNFDQLIKVTPSAIKVTSSAIKVTPFI